MKSKSNRRTFIASLFFVLGFSLVFALIGILLETVLTKVAYDARIWLSRAGGIIIILFGLYLTGMFKIKALEKPVSLINLNKTFGNAYLTSFIFGAAFAFGWSPCVGAVLGAVLTLAATQPGIAFILLISYSIGLGIPFLVVGLFTSQAQNLISKAGKWIKYLNIAFGIILILLGIIVFTDQLSRFSSLGFVQDITGEGAPGECCDTAKPTLSLTYIAISFLAGLVSFLSPCILPLIPAYLTYLASLALKKQK